MPTVQWGQTPRYLTEAHKRRTGLRCSKAEICCRSVLHCFFLHFFVTGIRIQHSILAALNVRIPLPGGLEQLNGIAVGIFYLYLLATGTNFHFVPETKSRFFHRLDLCG